MPADSSPSIHLTPLPLYSQKVKSTALCHRSLPADFTCSSYHNPPPPPPARYRTSPRCNSICLLVALISRGWNSWLQRVNWRDEMGEESEPWLMGRVEYKHTCTHAALASAHAHTQNPVCAKHTWVSSKITHQHSAETPKCLCSH